jgi:RHS repeat-associated protein
VNRLISKGYTDSYAPNPATMPAIYGYDGHAISGCPSQAPPGDVDSYPIGRRTAMCDGSGATNWTHDKMGRILQERRTIGTVAGKNDTDVYNLDGSVASLTSLGFQVTYAYNGAGRPLSALGGNSFVQSNSATYAPFGGLASAKMGPTPIVVTNKYNNRLQPLLISASAGSSIISLCYDFHMVAVPNPNTDCSLPVGLGNNGNVFKIVNNRDNNRTENFLYDPLNRISQAYTSGPNWGETFGPTATAPGVQPTSSGIDAWGNLTNRSGVTGKGTYEGLSAAPATVKNQLNGYCHDSAGNLVLNNPCPQGSFSQTYTYDSENRLITTAGISYIYDGDGKRVKKCTAGTIAGTCATNAVGTLYWSVPGGGTLTETDLAGNTLQNYVFFNGMRIARRDASGTVHFYFSDHLGTHSLITDLQGDMPPQEESDYYPYGGEIPVSGSDSNHYKFTGKERDIESGLDNFGARYDASSSGRFMTPDALGGNLVNPQSLNKYPYVYNNPLRYIDPTGMYVCADDPKDKSTHCASKQDKAFEKALAGLRGKEGDVGRAAAAYGAMNDDNGVTVGFADLTSKGEGGGTVSTIGSDDQGNLRANSAVTISSKLKGADFDAAIGHEGSHAADAQDVVKSGITEDGQALHAGQNITPYQSEQRAYDVTNAILSQENESRNYCGGSPCILGRGVITGTLSGVIDSIVANDPLYNQGGKPMSSSNQGPSVVNGVTPTPPKASVPH